jgi:hypothetical protein
MIDELLACEDEIEDWKSIDIQSLRADLKKKVLQGLVQTDMNRIREYTSDSRRLFQ